MNYKALLIILLTITYAHSEGIFEEWEEKAKEIVAKMTTDEKIGALFIVKHPKREDVKIKQGVNPSGYLLNADFFNTTDEVIDETLDKLQSGKGDVKFIVAVEEEGGEHVAVSHIHRDEPFKLPMDVMFEGGQTQIIETFEEKMEFLKGMHVNMNIALVADICENKNSFMYARTLGLGSDKVSEFSTGLIDEYVEHKWAGCVKHFPGYGDNSGSISEIIEDVVDPARREDYEKPFKDAIDAGVPAVFMSNLIIPSVDNANPVSVSKTWSDRILKDMGFTGVLIADLPIRENYYLNAINNGYEMILTEDFETSVANTQDYLSRGLIQDAALTKTVERITAFKLGYIKHYEHEDKKKKKYTGLILGVGIASFVLITIIAYGIYKFILQPKEAAMANPAEKSENLI